MAGLEGARPGTGVNEARRRIREVVPHLERDREPGPDLAAAAALVHDGRLSDLAGSRDPVSDSLERPRR
jgi:histidine ammonia-lyase